MKNYFQAKHLLFFSALLFLIIGGFYFNSIPTKVEAACSATDQYPDPASPYPAGYPIPNGFCHENCYTGETWCHCNAGYHNAGTNDEPSCVADIGLSGAISPNTSNCTIARLANRCNQTLTWSTTGAPAGVSSIITNSGGATPSSVTGNNGSQSFSIPYTVAGGFIPFSLKNGTTPLDQAIVTARCGTGDGWDGSKCVGLPDLTASAPIPAMAAPGTAQTFHSTISNIGGASTGAPFSYFFQKATAANGGGTITDLTSGSMATLAAGGTATASSPAITFALGDTPSIRVCADKTNRNSTTPATGAVIAESNENNNCSSSWTNVSVTNNMFGNLSATNCTIAAGNSSCNTSLNWSTTNPVGTSAVTSSYPNANTTVASGNSGTNVSALVPYSSRTFYLYNNAVQLATATATATCASGTAWSDNQNTCVVSPISVSLFADPAGPLTEPGATTLYWLTTGTPNSCVATTNGAWTGPKSVSGGSTPISGLTAGAHNYTITCSKDRPAIGDTVTATSVAVVTVNTPGNGDTNSDCGSVQYTCVSPTATVGSRQSYPTIHAWTCTSGDGTTSKACSVRSGSPGFIEN